MPETMSEARPVDAAASYCDPRAVPLRHAAKLLDSDFSKIFDDTDQDELLTSKFKSGRYRIIGYEHPRRMSDGPVLVTTAFVRRAFQDLRHGRVYDPVHDRVVQRLTVIGTPSAWMLREMPELREQRREQQRLTALPLAIDWQGCRIRAGRYAFVDCKAIRAGDLVSFASAEVSEAPPDTPPPARLDRLEEVLTELFAEEQAWEKADGDDLADAVSRRDRRFLSHQGPSKRGRWSRGTLKQRIREVRVEAKRQAEMRRSGTPGNY